MSRAQLRVVRVRGAVSFHSMFEDRQGRVWGLGDCSDGQLGCGSRSTARAPVLGLGLGHRVVDHSVGIHIGKEYSAIAVHGDKQGQPNELLWTGRFADSNSWVPPPSPVRNVTRVCAGPYSMWVLAGGRLLGVGRNSCHQLGHPEAPLNSLTLVGEQELAGASISGLALSDTMGLVVSGGSVLCNSSDHSWAAVPELQHSAVQGVACSDKGYVLVDHFVHPLRPSLELEPPLNFEGALAVGICHGRGTGYAVCIGLSGHEVWTWGTNGFGERGKQEGPYEGATRRELPLEAGEYLREFSCAGWHVMVITSLGRVLSWGCRAQYRIGREGDAATPLPVDFPASSPDKLEVRSLWGSDSRVRYAGWSQQLHHSFPRPFRRVVVSLLCLQRREWEREPSNVWALLPKDVLYAILSHLPYQ